MGFLGKRNNIYILLFIVLMIGLGLRIYSGLHKAYFFHDGIFTLELINSDEWAKERTNEDNYNKVISGKVFYEDMRISSDEKFDFSSFTSVLRDDDIHPPLYYWLLHPFQVAISDGEVSWWPGLILNFIFYILTGQLIYKIAFIFIKDKVYSVFPVAFFSVSPAMVSTDMMLRMYSELGFFSLWFIYSSIVFFKEGYDRKISLGLFLSCLLGALTHHYFLCLALFSFFILSFGFLMKKSYRDYVIYISVLVCSGVFYLLIWPDVFRQIFQSKLTHSIVQDIGSLTTFEDLFMVTNYYLFSGFFYYFCFVFLLLVFLGFKGFFRNRFYFCLGYSYVYILVLTFSMFFLVFQTKPFDILDGSYRYFYIPNLLMVCSFGVLFSSLLKSCDYPENKKIIFGFLVFLVFSLGFKLDRVDYLFLDSGEDGSLIKEFWESSDVPVIIKLRDDWESAVFEEDQKDWTIVNLMPYLHNKNTIYIVNDKELEESELKNIIKDLGVDNGGFFYVVSTAQTDFFKILDDSFGGAIKEESIRYNNILKYRYSF